MLLFEELGFGTAETMRAMCDAAREYGAHYMEFSGMGIEGLELLGAEQLGYIPAVEKVNTRLMEILHRGTEAEDFLEDRFGLLDGNQDEVYVLHFHPGYLDQYLLDNTSLTLPRCKDLQALCDPRVSEWLTRHGIELVGYSAIVKN